MLAKKYCKDCKDCVSRSLRSNILYIFTCAECNSVYVGETKRHLSTRIREHLFIDKNSNVYKHLNSSSACREHSTSTAHKRRNKEALHILWEGPNLNKRLNHYNI